MDKRARFEATAIPLLGSIRRTANRLCGAVEGADLVQETYLRAYRTFDSFVPGTNCRAWLFKIMYSISSNRTRKARHEPSLLAFDEEFDRALGTSPTDAALLEGAFGRMTSPDVESALAELPEAFRSAVILVDVEELSYEEAAEALACPVGTLRSRLFRGRKKLFAALQDYAVRRGLLKKEVSE
jgi:RNA polymerase sigma-70 factor (ECF subfamily)